MARFRSVDLYPFSGYPDHLWDSLQYPPGDPLRDAVLRAARPVVSLYTEALERVDVSGPRSLLLVAVTHGRAADSVELEISQREPDQGPEWGYATLCPDVGRLDERGRAVLVLHVVHAAARGLARARGWDPGVFDLCREHVESRDFVYRWAGPWKSSPDRKHQARAAYELAEPDGFGRAWLEVRRRGDEHVRDSSPLAIASCEASRFARSASTLTWDGSELVGFAPFVGAPGGRGVVSGRLEGGAWTFVVRDEVTVRTPGGEGIDDDRAAPVPAVAVSLV